MNKILVVDDEPHVVRVLRLRLERAGYEVTTALNGEAALSAIEQSQPDVLITDVQMPRMTGRELCEQIEARFPERNFPIFVLTSRTEMEHREWSQTVRNAIFLEKPVSIAQILSALTEYFTTGHTVSL